jgi:hypothetical protein
MSQAVLTSSSHSCLVSAKSKIFVVSLIKDRADMEQHFQDAIKDGHFMVGALKDLLRYPGVTHAANSVFMDLKLVPEDIKNTWLSINALSTDLELFSSINKERLSVIRQLREMGYKVAVPDYGLPSFKGGLELVRPYAKVFRMQPPVIGKIGNTIEVASSASWTRDLWHYIGGKRVVRFESERVNPEGEGGMIVPIGKDATLVSQELIVVNSVREMAAKGHRLYFLRDGRQFMPNLSKLFSKDVFMTNDHVDLFAGVVGNVMLLDESYYTGLNKTILRQAARENRLKIVFIPPEEARFYPANFLKLGDNKILMEMRAERTMALLRENGIDVVPTETSLNANLRTGGGVRCFTNEL